MAAELVTKGLGNPDEVCVLDKTRIEVFHLAGQTIMRVRFEPGWKWTECVKPQAGTDFCETDHLGYVVSGRCTTVLRDGSKIVLRAGDLFSIPAGHDGWVEGDEPFEALDFLGGASYGK